MQEDQHKHLRRMERVWVESPVYFVTACTYGRQRILADADVAGILTDEWRAAHERHGWLVGRYVVMPDHVHFFCAAEHDAKTLSEFVRLWKQWTTKRMKTMKPRLTEPRLASAATTAGVETGRGTTRVWQREFFDHVLRSEESYAEKWEYVRENPVRANLVKSVWEWAFQGEIHLL
jgi:REP-associated tyrosine transposase